MALFFSSPLTMDKFVISRVVTVIDYLTIAFLIRLAVANRIDDAAEFVLNGLFLAALPNTRMHLSTWRVQLDVRIGSRKITTTHVADKSFERGKARRGD
jgi:hypothetical protein